MKQWLNYLRRTYPEAQEVYDTVRTLNDSRQMQEWLQTHLPLVAPLKTDDAHHPGTCASAFHCAA